MVTGDGKSSYDATAYDSAGNAIGSNPNNQGAFGVFDPNNNTLATEDLNGNFSDATGSIVLTVGQAVGNSYSYSCQDQLNNQQPYTLTYTPYMIQTNFGCHGITEFPPLKYNLLTNVQRPDKTNYIITYELTPLQCSFV